MTREFSFVTPCFTAKTLTLPEDVTIADARRALAPSLHCSPEDLHIFSGGRKLDDTEKVATVSLNRRKPVVYRHIPIGEVASDPPDFDPKLENLMFVVINAFDPETVGDVLRFADYDVEQAVEVLLAMAAAQPTEPSPPAPPPASTDVPTAVWRQLEQVKPANLAMDAAIALYRDVCAGDLEMAIGMLRAMPSQ
jgi:hypothetical protein